MAIDIYSQAQEEPRWKKILLAISITLMVIVIGIFVFQKFIKIPNNEKQILELNAQISMQGVPVQLAQKELVLNAEKKIEAFKGIYNNNPVFENFFTDFEKWIYPRVYFTSFNLSVEDAKLELSGQTDTLQSLMQQMIVFDNQENIESFTISNIVTEEGVSGVTFDASINVNPMFFKKTSESLESVELEINNNIIEQDVE